MLDVGTTYCKSALLTPSPFNYWIPLRFLESTIFITSSCSHSTYKPRIFCSHMFSLAFPVLEEEKQPHEEVQSRCQLILLWRITRKNHTIQGKRSWASSVHSSGTCPMSWILALPLPNPNWCHAKYMELIADACNKTARPWREPASFAVPLVTATTTMTTAVVVATNRFAVSSKPLFHSTHTTRTSHAPSSSPPQPNNHEDERYGGHRQRRCARSPIICLGESAKAPAVRPPDWLALLDGKPRLIHLCPAMALFQQPYWLCWQDVVRFRRHEKHEMCVYKFDGVICHQWLAEDAVAENKHSGEGRGGGTSEK